MQGDEFGAQATQFEFEFGLGGACQHAVGEVERLVFRVKGAFEEIVEALLREKAPDGSVGDPVEVALGAATDSIAGE